MDLVQFLQHLEDFLQSVCQLDLKVLELFTKQVFESVNMARIKVIF